MPHTFREYEVFWSNGGSVFTPQKQSSRFLVGALNKKCPSLTATFFSQRFGYYQKARLYQYFMFFKIADLTVYTMFLLNLLTFHISAHRINTIHIFINRTLHTHSKKLVQKLEIFRKGRHQNFCDTISSRIPGTANFETCRDIHYMGNPITFERQMPKFLGNAHFVCFLKKFWAFEPKFFR